jgi:hypothetical protein
MANHVSRLMRLLIPATGLLLTIVGCQSARVNRGHVANYNIDNLAINREQLRLRVRALVGPITGKIESAADEIAATSTDVRVQRAALEWKIDAVPAMREALFLPTPSMALMDAWVLLHQMNDYFDHGPGKARFGASNEKAAAACRSLEDDMAHVAASATVSGDVSTAREYVRKWAADHPITGTIAAREPVNSVEFRKDLGDTLSVGESAAAVAITLDDLDRKLASFSSQLPRQARWEIDRQRYELTDTVSSMDVRPLAERTVTSAEHVAAAIDRLAPSLEAAAHAAEGAARTAEGAPETLATERRAAVEAINAELSRTIAFAQGERLAALAYLTDERKAMMDDFHKTIGGEQRALGSEIDQLSVRIVDHAIDRMERFVWEMLAAIVGALFGGIVLVRVLFGRPSAAAGRQLV